MIQTLVGHDAYMKSKSPYPSELGGCQEVSDGSQKGTENLNMK